MNASSPSALIKDPAFAPLRRSLEVYYGDAGRDAAMDALYSRFVKPGGLTSATGSAVSADSVRGWWRWSRSRCARV
jgi:hypothetical protein